MSYTVSKVKVFKKRPNYKVKVIGYNVGTCRKVARNTHVKYQSSSTHCSSYSQGSSLQQKYMITIFYLLQREIIHHMNKHYQRKLTLTKRVLEKSTIYFGHLANMSQMRGCGPAFKQNCILFTHEYFVPSMITVGPVDL